WRIAHELGEQQPLVFIARTTSTARDLFYTYDALRRFVDAQAAGRRGARPRDQARGADARNYITYPALGLAILLAMPPELADSHPPAEYRGLGPRRSVVLIDEIDKAPRDFPNDILNEVERMQFTVPETGFAFPGFDERLQLLPAGSRREEEERRIAPI